MHPINYPPPLPPTSPGSVHFRYVNPTHNPESRTPQPRHPHTKEICGDTCHDHPANDRYFVCFQGVYLLVAYSIPMVLDGYYFLDHVFLFFVSLVFLNVRCIGNYFLLRESPLGYLSPLCILPRPICPLSLLVLFLASFLQFGFSVSLSFFRGLR